MEIFHYHVCFPGCRTWWVFSCQRWYQTTWVHQLVAISGLSNSRDDVTTLLRSMHCMVPPSKSLPIEIREIIWTKLVGGCFNPFEKYAKVKLGIISPILGVKIKNVWNHHLANLHDFWLQNVSIFPSDSPPASQFLRWHHANILVSKKYYYTSLTFPSTNRMFQGWFQVSNIS